MAKTKFCQGLSDISDSYMGIIFDQWGVLHDGEKAFPGVVDCLKELKERKKSVVLLSNSPIRADESKARLKKMGIGPSLYTKIVTSGELIAQGLQEKQGDVFGSIGPRCFLISRKGDQSLVKDTGVEVVEKVEDADFILIAGSDAPNKMITDYESDLRKGVQKRLKALCVNPDSRALISTNYLMGPGLIARRYQDFGGIVHYIGKPHKPIFDECIRILQTKEVYPSQTVMIGDTMAHDILGAHNVAIDTCLVKSGMHFANFAHCQTLKEVDNALKNLMAVYNNVMPHYLVDEVRWGKALPDRKHKKRKQPAS